MYTHDWLKDSEYPTRQNAVDTYVIAPQWSQWTEVETPQSTKIKDSKTENTSTCAPYNERLTTHKLGIFKDDLTYTRTPNKRPYLFDPHQRDYVIGKA